MLERKHHLNSGQVTNNRSRGRRRRSPCPLPGSTTEDSEGGEGARIYYYKFTPTPVLASSVTPFSPFLWTWNSIKLHEYKLGFTFQRGFHSGFTAIESPPRVLLLWTNPRVWWCKPHLTTDSPVDNSTLAKTLPCTQTTQSDLERERGPGVAFWATEGSR